MVEPKVLDGNMDPIYRIRDENRLAYGAVVSTLSCIMLGNEGLKYMHQEFKNERTNITF